MTMSLINQIVLGYMIQEIWYIVSTIDSTELLQMTDSYTLTLVLHNNVTGCTETIIV